MKKQNMIFETANISNLLSEIIDTNDIDVKSIHLNDELNPLFWQGGVLKRDVRKALLLNAKRFIEFCDLDNYNFNDIVLTGSIANYNYNENSDVDIHIIMDFDQIHADRDFVESYFKLKKSLWAEKIPVQIKGYDVELYVQDLKEKHHSSGIYSLVHNKWISKPIKKLINIDVANLKLKAGHFVDKINQLEGIDDNDEFIIKDDITYFTKKLLQINGRDYLTISINDNLFGEISMSHNTTSNFITFESQSCVQLFIEYYCAEVVKVGIKK